MKEIDPEIKKKYYKSFVEASHVVVWHGIMVHGDLQLKNNAKIGTCTLVWCIEYATKLRYNEGTGSVKNIVWTESTISKRSRDDCRNVILFSSITLNGDE